MGLNWDDLLEKGLGLFGNDVWENFRKESGRKVSKKQNFKEKSKILVKKEILNSKNVETPSSPLSQN